MARGQAHRLGAEALGTFTLVFVASLAVLAATGGGDARILAIAFGFGLAILAGLYAFGEISGGHFNPAVSLGMMLSGRLSPQDLIGYWVAQLVGATLGSLAVLAAFTRDDVASTANAVAPGHTNWDALWLEFLVTAVFVAVILQSSRSDRMRGTALLAIPLTLVVAHLALIPIDGCSVNPARSFGPALVGGEWGDFWIFLIAPLLGGVLGAVVHGLLFPRYVEEVTVVEVTV
jgi:MIP family channel proteins